MPAFSKGSSESIGPGARKPGGNDIANQTANHPESPPAQPCFLRSGVIVCADCSPYWRDLRLRRSSKITKSFRSEAIV